jgi:hypothetical protein
MKNASLLLLFAVIFFLGCDSEPPKKQTSPSGGSQTSASQLETGRFALQKMLPAARLWAVDGQPVRMRSQPTKDSNGQDGKSSFWQTTFVSPSRQKSEAFSWSGMSGADAPPKGVDHGREDSYNPANRSIQPFDLSFLKIDSDKAFAVAQQHGGKQLLTKTPGLEVMYVLDWDSPTGKLRWHVIYGGNESRAQLIVIVDASTAEFIHKE